MNGPDEDRLDSSEAPGEKGQARPPGEPARGRWTLVPSAMPFGGGRGPGDRDGGPESRQITIAELLLVMLIAAVVLGVLRIVPGGYSYMGALLGFGGGCMVLVILRPKRAISDVAWWLMFGFLTLHVALEPDWADGRILFCVIFVFYIVSCAFPPQWTRVFWRSLAFHPEWSLAAHWLWWVFLGICTVLFGHLLVTGLLWVSVNVPWWLPLLLYALATAAALWRVLHSSHTESSQ